LLPKSPLSIAQSWQEAANRQQIERVLELSDPDIEVIAPRGMVRGHKLLKAWLQMAGLRMETRCVFTRGDSVVLAQHCVWRSLQTGDVTGEADIATSFRVKSNRVSRLARFDSVDAALKDAGLSKADEQPK
jgi:hypothetical protein